MGALLVVTAGVGTFTVAGGEDATPTTDYAVLNRSVDPGHVITSADVDWRPMVLDDEVGERTVTDPSELDDAVALVPMNPGELVPRSQIARQSDEPGAASASQLSLPVPIDRTPPGLRRGERVALLATYGSGTDAATVVTVQSATVLSYETDPDAIGGHDTGRLTIALDDPAALVASAHAAQVAELTIVRTTASAGPIPDRFDGATVATPPSLDGDDGRRP